LLRTNTSQIGHSLFTDLSILESPESFAAAFRCW
jgi:hypothetical protein